MIWQYVRFYLWCSKYIVLFFFFNDTATTEIYTLSLHDALPISIGKHFIVGIGSDGEHERSGTRSEEHTSELQSLRHLVCRLLLEKKKHITTSYICSTTMLPEAVARVSAPV